MRRVGGLLLGLVLLGWILVEVPVARTEPPPAVPQWKRTVDGWERHSSWSAGPYVQPRSLHPAVLGAFELLVSLMILLAPTLSPRPVAGVATSGGHARTDRRSRVNRRQSAH